MIYCKNCGSQMNEGQAICLQCGVKTGDGNNYCANCGKPLAAGATVCLNCGFAVFFLGGLGIHNFMMGETKKGIFRIVMTLCCGIGYIFALIDFVKILTDKYVIAPTELI